MSNFKSSDSKESNPGKKSSVVSKNPWMGLRSYTEQEKDSFFGRADDVQQLLDLVLYTPFVTLYGRSGIGKTSLLQAGLFPRLRNNRLFPVVVRFDPQNDLSEQIINLLESNLELDEPKSTEGSGEDPDKLYNYFSSRKFFYPKNIKRFGTETEVYPVIVLDQFEEILRNHAAAEHVDMLLRQLNVLVCGRPQSDGSNYACRFRVIVSLREDDLFLLEDKLDTLHLTDLKQPRFRLRPLEDDGVELVFKALATQAKLLPPNSEEADAVFEKLKDKLKVDSADGEKVNTLLLSYYCSRLYEICTQSNGKLRPLKATDVDNLGEHPLSELYRKAALDRKQRQFVLKNMISSDGEHRQSVSKGEIEKVFGNRYDELSNGDTLLFTNATGRDNKDARVELIHDQLAAAITAVENERRQQQARNWRIAFWGVIGLVVIAILTAIIVPWHLRHNSTQTQVHRVFESCKIQPESIYDTTATFVELIGEVKVGRYNIFEKCDTLKLTHFKGYWSEEAFPNVTTLILDSVDARDGLLSLYLPRLRQSCVKNESTQPILVEMGDVYVGNNRVPFLRSRTYKKTSKDIRDAVEWRASYVYDIAHPTDYDFAKIEVLYCSDSTKKVITAEDCPRFLHHLKVIWFPYAEEVELRNYSLTINDKSECYLYLPQAKVVRSDQMYKGVTYANLPKVEEIEKNTFWLCNLLTEVDAPNLKRVDGSAFNHCSNLAYFYAPRLEYVGDHSFEETALVGLDVPSLEGVGYAAFQNCKKFAFIHAPRLEYVSEMAFQGTALTEFSSSCEDIGGYAFSNCKELHAVSLPHIKNLPVCIFSGCEALSEVYLPEVTKANEAFVSCHSLKNISLPKCEEFIGRTFAGCYNLTHIAVPNWGDGSHNILSIFDSCFRLYLDSMDIPQGRKDDINRANPNRFVETPHFEVKGDSLIFRDRHVTIEKLDVPRNITTVVGYNPRNTTIEKLNGNGGKLIRHEGDWYRIGSSVLLPNKETLNLKGYVATTDDTLIFPPATRKVLLSRPLLGLYDTTVAYFIPYGKRPLFERTMPNCRIEEMSWQKTWVEYKSIKLLNGNQTYLICLIHLLSALLVCCLLYGLLRLVMITTRKTLLMTRKQKRQSLVLGIGVLVAILVLVEVALNNGWWFFKEWNYYGGVTSEHWHCILPIVSLWIFYLLAVALLGLRKCSVHKPTTENAS